MYPVKIGESWELKGPQIALFQALANARSVAGQAYLRLEEIQEHNGKKCALISQRIEVIVDTMLGDQDIQMSIGGYGSNLRSLEDLIDLRYQLSGQMKMTLQKSSNDSERLTMVSQMDINVIDLRNL